MRFLALLTLLISFNLHALETTPDALMRESWVKTLKELMGELELKNKDLLVQNEKQFLEIISSAFADSRYNCFYGGWPSVKNGKYCQNPSKTNSSYDKNACKSDELQCQPLLFGKGLCVSSKTQNERNKTFANCESKFQKEHKGKYDFLNSPTRKESEDLQELSRLAHEICVENSSGICKKVLKKFPAGMKAIDQGFQRSVASEEEAPSATPTASAPPVEATHAPDCEDPEHEHENLAQTVAKVVEKSSDSLYDKIKTEFLSSPFCDPQKIVNDPNDRPSGFVIAKLSKDLSKIDPAGRSESNEAYLKRLSDKYKLSDSVISETLTMLNSIKGSQDYETRRTIAAKARIMIAQDLISTHKPDGSFNDLIKESLVENNIFIENENGEAECPFVSKEAFDKAIEGRKKVLAQHGKSLTNKNQITILDYSRPSNERRMFVIDLETGKVLHNTWVAHGGGGGNATGVDGLGSSPQMSNTSGSNLSSDGFIIATQKSSGKLFGPNVLLKGIDVANSNLAARAVVLHGWGSPLYQYSTGVEDYNSSTESYDPPYDVVERVRKANPKLTERKELEKAWNSLSSSSSNPPYMNATEGCLGVPMINVKHLDRKGRNKSQLELLRDDLPGSLIFNYSGPEMKSKYF